MYIERPSCFIARTRCALATPDMFAIASESAKFSWSISHTTLLARAKINRHWTSSRNNLTLRCILDYAYVNVQHRGRAKASFRSPILSGDNCKSWKEFTIPDSVIVFFPADKTGFSRKLQLYCRVQHLSWYVVRRLSVYLQRCKCIATKWLKLRLHGVH